MRRNIGIQVGRTSSAKVGVHASKRRARVTAGSRGVVVVIFLDDEDECREGEKDRKIESRGRRVQRPVDRPLCLKIT